MHLLFTAWCSEAAGEHQEHPAQRGDELGAGRQRGRQGQPCRAARAVRAPAVPTVGRHKAGLCLASSHSWSSSPATREGAHSPWSHLGVLALDRELPEGRDCRGCWCTWDLEMYPRAMCFSNYPSQLTINGITFFFFVFLFFNLWFWYFRLSVGRKKKFLVGHEHKSGSTWQFSCYFQHIWLLESLSDCPGYPVFSG